MNLFWPLAIGLTTCGATPVYGEPPSERTRLAVMRLEAAGAPTEYVEGVTETIATAVANTEVFETISPRQIAALLAYEKRRELLGGCVDEECYVQVARLVKARHLVGGSVARLGDKIVLNLVLVDAEAGSALNRTHREAEGSAAFLSEVRAAAIVLLQPLLSARQGYLKVAANVPNVQLVVDDTLRIEKAGQVISLAAGPHILEVRRDGFYRATADVFIRPGRVRVEEVKLIPARETVEAYESKAQLMRYGAYASAGVAVVAGVLAGAFYTQATDDKNLVDAYNASPPIDRPAVASRPEVVDADNGFATHQALYLSMLGTAVAAGGVSLYLFLAGEDPDRYEEFHSLTGLD